jgi:hypothetical protein
MRQKNYMAYSKHFLFMHNQSIVRRMPIVPVVSDFQQFLYGGEGGGALGGALGGRTGPCGLGGDKLGRVGVGSLTALNTLGREISSALDGGALGGGAGVWRELHCH